MIELPSELKAQFDKLSEHYFIKALDQLFHFALKINASDLHFESQQETLRIRLRIDGVLHSVLSLPIRFGPMILSRLKMLAHLDIAEKRLPQDGRFEIREENLTIGGRISTCPTCFGEKAVVRLLSGTNHFISLELQGMTPVQLQEISHLIESPHGLVIITGPTGSGKTMTLYALLERLNNETRNLITVEDPVEMLITGINQIQVQEKAGLDFKMILRSLLRQDPDVLMIGEIRDRETAEIAIKAAQTGHLVLSTLHTASSILALSRLEQLGLPRYLILESTKLIVAQRLVRKLCKPCSLCVDGFRGRTGIFELLALTPNIQHKLLHNQPVTEADYIDQLTLLTAGQHKVSQRITTLEEVKRVV